MNYIALVGVFAVMSVVAATVLAFSADATPSLNASENHHDPQAGIMPKG